MATVESEYSSHLIRINAGDEPNRVFLNLCEAVEKPVSTVWEQGIEWINIGTFSLIKM